MDVVFADFGYILNRSSVVTFDDFIEINNYHTILSRISKKINNFKIFNTFQFNVWFYVMILFLMCIIITTKYSKCDNFSKIFFQYFEIFLSIGTSIGIYYLILLFI